MAEGVFTIRLETADAYGHMASSVIKAFTVLTSLPEIKDLAIKSTIFSLSQSTTVSFTGSFVLPEIYRKSDDLNKTLKLETKIYDSAQNLIRELKGTYESGNFELNWDGRDSKGSLVADGAYVSKFQLVDSNNRRSEISELNFSIDSSVPTISQLTINPAIAKAGTVTMSFLVSEVIDLEPRIEIPGISSYYQPVLSSKTMVGTQSYYKFTSPINSNFSQGVFVVNISVTDNAGNSILASTQFTIDTKLPTLSVLTITPNPTSASTLWISFESDEALAGNPEVKLNGNSITRYSKLAPASVQKSLVPRSINAFNYALDINSNQTNGTANITIQFVDTAQNSVTITSSLLIDTQAPSVSITNQWPQFINSQSSQWLLDFTVQDSNLAFTPLVKLNQYTYSSQAVTDYQLGSLSTSNIQNYNFSSADLSGFKEGTNNITIFSKDTAGNQTNYELAFFVDTLVPVLPSLNTTEIYTNQDSNVITGSAEQNSQIIIHYITPKSPLQSTGEGTSVFLSVTTNTQGSWQTTINLTEGRHELSIGAVDLYQNTSAGTVSKIINCDKTSPSIVTINVLPALSSTGQVTINFTVSEQLSGVPYVKLPPLYSSNLGGDSIDFLVSAQLGGTTGGWVAVATIPSDAAQGTYNIEIHVTDNAGNTALSILRDALSVDTIAPSIPTVTSVPTLTNQATNIISGTTEPGNIVIVELVTNLPSAIRYPASGVTSTLAADSNGHFSTTISLTSDTNTISIQSKDAAGNWSSAWTQAILFDTIVPTLNSFSITPTLSTVGQVTISFTVSEPLSSEPVIYLYPSGIGGISGPEFISVISVISGSGNGGSYSYTATIPSAATQGAYNVEMIITDNAGNSSLNVMRDALSVDTIAPEIPNISESPTVTNLALQYITGQTEGLNKLIINQNNVALTPVYANANGEFRITVNLSIGSNIFIINSKDAAGNISLPWSKSYTLDTENPVFSEIIVSPNPAKAGTVTISFYLSKPVVDLPQLLWQSGSPLTGQLVSNNFYLYTAIVLTSNVQGNQSISLIATDNAGNIGSAVTDFIVDTIAPQTPTLTGIPTLTNQATRIISGTTEPGNTVIVELNANSPSAISRPLSADANGHFSTNITLTSGTNTLSVQSQDAAGNWSATWTQIVILDSVNPVFSNLQVSAGLVKSGIITITFSVNETLAKVPTVSLGDNLFTLASSNGNTYTYSYLLADNYASGQYQIEIAGSDLAGNYGQALSSFFSVDTVVPELTLFTGFQSFNKAGVVTISFTVSEILLTAPIVVISNSEGTKVTTITAQADANTIYNIQYQITDTDPQGHYQLSIQITDLAGNSASLNNQFLVDTVLPGINPVSVNPTLSSIGQVTISFTVSEELSSDPYLIIRSQATNQISIFSKISVISGSDNLGSYTYTATIPSDSAQGTYNVEISVTDNAQNTNKLTINSALLVDTIVPQTPIITGVPTLTNQATQIISGTTEAGNVVLVRANNYSPLSISADGAGSFSTTITLSSGTNTLSVQSQDAAGNLSATWTQTATLDITVPVFSNLQLSSIQVKSGLFTITFNVSEKLAKSPTVSLGDNLFTLLSYSGNTYAYGYVLPDNFSSGQYQIKIAGNDLASNYGQALSSFFSVDTVAPELTLLTGFQSFNKAGVVTISFTASEILLTAPIVVISNSEGTKVTTITAQADDNTIYNIQYQITDIDPQGPYLLAIQAVDLAGNTVSLNSQFLVDTVLPVISAATINPTLTSIGQVTINFTVSEALKSDPVVILKGADNSSLLSGTLEMGFRGDAGGATYTYTVPIDSLTPTGTYNLSVRVTDNAGNASSYAMADALRVDTIAPEFSDISLSPSLLKAGDTLRISFSSNETLADNPRVTINYTRLATLNSNVGNTYIYEDVIQSSDNTGVLQIAVAGRDLAGNYQSKIATTVIDNTIPVLSTFSINPATFVPNAKPNTNQSLSTNISFEVSENVNWSINIANSSGQILKNYTGHGTQTIQAWDGLESVAKPYPAGVYTVEVQSTDNAGNRSMQNIQNVYLQINQLAVPTAQLYLNPQGGPYSPIAIGSTNISYTVTSSIEGPNPSIKLALKAAKLTVANLSATPVGIINLWLTDQNGNRVKTIISNLEANAGTDRQSASWDGKDTNGNYLTSGTYNIVITIRDYLDYIRATSSAQFVVDITPPVISGAGLQFITYSPAVRNYSNNLSCQLSDNLATTLSARLQWFSDTNYQNQVEEVSGAKNVGANVFNWQGRWPLDTGAIYASGPINYRLTVIDQAGNSANITGQAVLDKDAPVPISFAINTGSPYTNDPNCKVTLTLSVSDATTQVVKMRIANDSANFNAATTQPYVTSTSNWQLSAVDNTKYVYAQFQDQAGNWSESADDSIILDRIAPSGSFTINNNLPYSTSTEVNLTGIWASDTNQVEQLRYKNEVNNWTTISMPPVNTSITVVTLSNVEGNRSIKMQFKDVAGNWSGDVSDTIIYDYTAPVGGVTINTGDTYTKFLDASVLIYATDNWSGVSNYKISTTDSNWESATVEAYTTLPISFTLSTPDGDKYAYVRFQDGAGKWSNTITSKKIILDQTLPVISIAGSTQQDFNFNTTTANSIPFSVTITESGSGLATGSAGIYDGATLLKTINLGTPVVNPNTNTSIFSPSWDGTDSNGYYVNEGTYTLKVTATDVAGNVAVEKTQSIVLSSTLLLYSSTSIISWPGLKVSGSSIIIDWEDEENPDWVHYTNQLIGSNDLHDSSQFVITSNVYIKMIFDRASDNNDRWQCIMRNDDNVEIFNHSIPDGSDLNYFEENYRVNGDTYYFSNSNSNIVLNLNKKTKKLILNILDGIYSYNIYTAIKAGLNYQSSNSNTHLISLNNKVLTYQRVNGSISSVPITIATNVESASIVNINNSDYIVYVTSINGTYRLFSRKIPNSNSYITNSSGIVVNKVNFVSTLNVANLSPIPTLISPINSEIIGTPKPRFIWSVPQQTSDLSFYKLQLQQQTSPLDTQVITSDIDYTYELNAGDVSIKTGVTNNEISYQLNDYQSLAASSWLWRIGADFVPTDSVEIYTYSDSAAFKIEPDLSLTNVLNFPNPFESSTKIRYKLSKTVDEVIIYIFNLAGKLVRTLEGDTSGTSVVKEYHDIIWDGRNDLGEPVNNGLYPYKITATLNGRKVSEKGKAVRMR